MDEQTKLNILHAHYFVSPTGDDYDSATDYLVKYKNIQQLLIERKNKADIEYIKYFDESGNIISYNYSEFIDKVFQLSNYLIANSVKLEDRIATYSTNHVDTVILYFACWAIGAVVVPINVSEDNERVKYILENSTAKLIFTRDEFVDKLSKIIPENVSMVNFDELDYSSFHNEIHLSYDFDKESESMIVYTSGTTGNPKGVVLTQYNLMVDAHYIAEWHNIREDETMMCVLPIHHVNGTVVTIMTTMYAGGRLILNQKFQTNKFLQRIESEKVKVVSVVPTLLQFMIHSGEDRSKYNLKHFSHIICGAGPLTCEIAKEFEKKFEMRIVHGYGLSETTCYSCFIPYDLSNEEHIKWQNEYGFPAIGISIPCNEMDIQTESGESLNEGEKGEIVIRGHNVMKYYFDNDEVNRETFKNAWFRSGDEGFFKYDNFGRKYFFITGRLKEIIIRGGVNISPLEIDEVISSLEPVQAGIAVGFDNDWYGDEIGALVLLKPEYQDKDKNELSHFIIEKCREKLSFAKSPKIVIFSETIPVTSTGKYQRNKVKHLFEEFRSVQFR